MPGCTKPDPVLSGLLALIFALGGCSGSEAGGKFGISRLDANGFDGRVEIRCEQQLQLSAEAREALLHGVPLTIELELVVRRADSHTRVGGTIRRFELRYLPLSEHYQVSGIGPNGLATFPRLRHALAELSRQDLVVETGALPAGKYEVLARNRLDRRHMPPPMRLPTLFDPSWKHDSEWTTWPLTIRSET
jgi:hypothetical protein